MTPCFQAFEGVQRRAKRTSRAEQQQQQQQVEQSQLIQLLLELAGASAAAAVQWWDVWARHNAPPLLPGVSDAGNNASGSSSSTSAWDCLLHGTAAVTAHLPLHRLAALALRTAIAIIDGSADALGSSSSSSSRRNVLSECTTGAAARMPPPASTTTAGHRDLQHSAV
jgi:hypothetical protein